MTPPTQPAIVDIVQAQILALGWCLMGSTRKLNQGDIIPMVRRSEDNDEPATFAHPFSVKGLATEEDIQAVLKVLREVFPTAYLPPRPAGYWYKCVTD
jgi:hypothetical protein